MRPFAVALLASVVATFSVQAAEQENPYKSAKVGDTLSYKMTVKGAGGNFDGTLTQTITEKTEKEVTVKVVTKLRGQELPAREQKIDLTKEFDPSTAGPKGAKGEKLKEGKEKVKIGDKEYDCTWVTYKAGAGANAPKGVSGDTELKVWFCKDVPGMVKMTANTKVMNIENNMTIELTEFTNKK